MNEFVSAFTHVAATLDQLGIGYVVVGSVAASSWGAIRTTIDLDLVLTLQDVDPENVASLLAADDFYIPVTTSLEALRGTGSFNLLDPTTGAKIDLFVAAPDDEFERMRLSRRVETTILGVRTWVVTPEDLILAKLRWRTASDSERQWRDCFELAAINDLDLIHLRKWAPVLGVSDDLERLLGSIPD